MEWVCGRVPAASPLSSMRRFRRCSLTKTGGNKGEQAWFSSSRNYHLVNEIRHENKHVIQDPLGILPCRAPGCFEERRVRSDAVTQEGAAKQEVFEWFLNT